MTKKVDFYFDFASPNAYLSHKVMQSIKERTGAEINYIPVLLGGIFKLTNNKPPMEQFFGVKNKNEYQNIEMQRFIQRYGLDKFQMNPHFPVISLQIIRGAVAADMDGYLEEYIDKILIHMWEEPKKMDDPEYIYLNSNQIKTYEDADVNVKVIAGSFKEVNGSIKKHNIDVSACYLIKSYMQLYEIFTCKCSNF